MKAFVVTLILSLAMLGTAALGSVGTRPASAASPWNWTTEICTVTGPHLGEAAYYTAVNGKTGAPHCWADGKGPAD